MIGQAWQAIASAIVQVWQAIATVLSTVAQSPAFVPVVIAGTLVTMTVCAVHAYLSDWRE